MYGKLHLQSERGEISKVIFAGETIGDQDSALTSHSDRRGNILGPLPSEG